MDVLSFNNCSLRLLSCLGLLVTSIFGSYVFSPYQNVDAQEATTPADQHSSTSASLNNESSTDGGMGYDMSMPKTSNITGTFDLSQLVSGADFKIDFPEGWTGISQSIYGISSAIVSPEGISASTNMSSKPPSVSIMVMAADLSSLGFMTMATNASSHEDALRESSEMLGCELLDYSVVKINNANTVQYLQQCGIGEDETKVKSYLFASGNHSINIIVGGNPASFDENLTKVEQSIQSVKINKPGDMQQALSAVFNPTTPTG